jgi:predicted DNA-binding helix-hairpin-helix protein
MVSLDKIAHLAEQSRFDSLGPEAAVDREKLGTLGAGTRYDVCTSSRSSRSPGVPGICHSFTHDGRCVSLFKTLYTNHCTHQCNYCMNASGCSKKPQMFTYTPQELASLTLSLYRSNYIEGLFLSSGSGRDEDVVMERMLETVSLLRGKCGFQGYIHLKILPGCSLAHIQEAMELSDRVSINVEACSAGQMSEISPTKHYENDILQRQRYIRDLMDKVKVPAGQTTQMVVGAAGESDQDIFRRVICEYREMKIKRAYYSAFSPQPGTPFHDRSPQPLWREHRLYQMDWLYRVYGYSPQEIDLAFGSDGLLPNADPKKTLATQLLDSCLDPNTASFRELMRVPGIGPLSARRIMALRKRQRICRREELSSLGVRVRNASPFLKLNGWRDTTLEMWSG